MMGFIHVFVAVLSVLSVGQSAPVTSCESLIQPIEIQGRDQLLGTWTTIGEATDFPMSKEITDMFVENSWSRVTAAGQDGAIDVHQVLKMFGCCFKARTEILVENNMLYDPLFNSSARLLSTSCPDCLVSLSYYKIGSSTYRGVQLLSRRTKVSDAELEEFKQQAECLNLPLPAILSQDKGSCLDDSSAIDLTIELTEMVHKVVSQVERLLSSEGAMAMLTGLFS